MLDHDIALEDQDDDIIDLEDIIEMPAGPIDEDEDLDLDGDIFELDSDLAPEPERPAQKAGRPFTKQQAQGQSSGEEDLLKSFGDEPEEDEKLFEPVASRGPRKQSFGRAEPQVFEEEESLLDEFMDKPAMPSTGMRREEKADLAEKAAATKVAGEARSAEVDAESAISDESLESAASKAAAPVSAPIAPAADLSEVVEELIGRIESRLEEHIRTMVESRLPDLVRSIVSEEVEKLKKEL